MASISKDANGRRTIQFIGADSKRRSIRLGKVTQRIAEGVKVKVEHLAGAAMTGHALDDETARWVAGLDKIMADKLAAVGLIAKSDRAGDMRLAAFLDEYIAQRADTKLATQIVYGHTRRCLVEFFGADKSLRSITPGDADAWRNWLATEIKQEGEIVKKALGENTVRRRTGFAKQFFRVALRRRLIKDNPFADLQGVTVRANRERDYFLTKEDAGKVLAACPDAQWKLLFALSRYGGLRCPSEHLGLRWGDIDWARGRFTVTSPKTERHEGGASRVVPIFPELRPYLETAFDEAPEGTEFVITRYREPNVNLRTQLLKIIKRAELDPWPRLFHNLRATRQTELTAEFPLHVVCEWIGNSKLIAQEHYLRVTDGDFEKAVQNPVQQPAAGRAIARMVSQAQAAAHEKTPDLRESAVHRKPLPNQGMVATGLEPVTPTV